jgi:hypothetical protein
VSLLVAEPAAAAAVCGPRLAASGAADAAEWSADAGADAFIPAPAPDDEEEEEEEDDDDDWKMRFVRPWKPSQARGRDAAKANAAAKGLEATELLGSFIAASSAAIADAASLEAAPLEMRVRRRVHSRESSTM